MCVCVFYGMHVEIRGQFLGIQSFLLPLGHGIKLKGLKLSAKCLYPLSHLVAQSGTSDPSDSTPQALGFLSAATTASQFDLDR